VHIVWSLRCIYTSPLQQYGINLIMCFCNVSDSPNISDAVVVWVRNNSGLYSTEQVQTGCLPLVDRNLATISTTGILIGALCVDFLDPQLAGSDQVTARL